MKETKTMTVLEVLDYETRSNRLASHISNKWIQKIIAKYLANKVRRKYGRYYLSKNYEQLKKTET